ncbi:MAG TPA: glutamine cyclotransferase [Bacteroidales bacterium]|nr:glutamine cyclotransferase [Bacteroidales bacterium]
MNTRIFLILAAVLTIFACNSNPENTSDSVNDSLKNKAIETKSGLNFAISPYENYSIIGDEFELTITMNSEIKVDSVSVFLGEKLIQKFTELPAKVKVNTKDYVVGFHEFKAVLNDFSEIKTQQIQLFSDLQPKKYTIKVNKTYPHDIGAYTQGLIMVDGWFYESTGMQGESTVRKVKPETGEIFQSNSMAKEIFGEGITKFGDKLVHLSWQSYTGFVYDFKTFKLEKQFSYATEGWGITHNGKQLIMSDGTENLYFLDPTTYAVVKTLGVYSNIGPTKQLNELEYIKGKIFANVYMTDEIVIINPENGKVEGIINCAGLLTEKDKHPNIDVLNGIAYDEKTGKMYITGKRWPKLFEVSY